jgi:hypothetical protein
MKGGTMNGGTLLFACVCFAYLANAANATTAATTTAAVTKTVTATYRMCGTWTKATEFEADNHCMPMKATVGKTRMLVTDADTYFCFIFRLLRNSVLPQLILRFLVSKVQEIP